MHHHHFDNDNIVHNIIFSHGRAAEMVEQQTNVTVTLGNQRNPLSPLVGKKIYSSMCIPKLLYGLEACVLNEECLLVVETAHRYCARKLQGLPPQTPIVVPLATLGLQTIESMLHCNKMMMLYSWLSLPFSCIYKKVVIARLVYHLTDTGSHLGALYEALQLCRQYGIDEYIVRALETGQTMSKAKWKRMVHGVVKERELVRWELTVPLYSSIPLFRECITSISVSVWWHVSQCRPHLTRATRILVRLLCGQHGLATSTARYRNANRGHVVPQSRLCTLCDLDVPETVEHFLFGCSRLNMLREILLMNLEMLPNMYIHMSSLNVTEKTVFLLSGMGGKFIVEWLDTYTSIANFVFQMYIHRHNLVAQV